MSNLLSQLAKSEQAQLLEELNYMNLEEIRGFCSERGIPYRILAEYPNGKVKATKDTDRKPMVLARVRRYLTTGRIGQPTRISARIVQEKNPPARPGPRDRLYYRWYAGEFEGVMRLLRDLTAGRSPRWKTACSLIPVRRYGPFRLSGRTLVVKHGGLYAGNLGCRIGDCRMRMTTSDRRPPAACSATDRSHFRFERTEIARTYGTRGVWHNLW